ACDPRARRTLAGGDDPDPRHEHDPRAAGVDRKRPRLLVDVPGVVVAVPGRVAIDAAPERLGELRRAVRLRVEVDDERLVLRVDQVVRARRADLADLTGPPRRREGDRFRAPVDLEDDAVGVVLEVDRSPEAV